MKERRTDHLMRKRVAEMSPDEMRQALLVPEKTDLPNRRAFEEGEISPYFAMSDVNGLKTLNDHFGYTAGDILIRRFADFVLEVGLDAYHDKGDEFLFKGESIRELNQKLCKAQHMLRAQPFAVSALDGRITTLNGRIFALALVRTLKKQKFL